MTKLILTNHEAENCLRAIGASRQIKANAAVHLRIPYDCAAQAGFVVHVKTNTENEQVQVYEGDSVGNPCGNSETFPTLAEFRVAYCV